MERILSGIEKEIERFKENEPFCVIFEGNVASGKTKFFENTLKYLEEKKNELGIYVVQVKENVEDNIELFKKYRENPKEYAFDFQEWIVKHKVEQLKKKMEEHEQQAKGKKIIIMMDRSFLADYYVFCRKHYQDGNLTKEQFEALGKLVGEVHDEFPYIFKPMLTICMCVTAEKALQRSMERNRSGEKNYSLEEMTRLQNLHEELYSKLWGRVFSYHHDQQKTQTARKQDSKEEEHDYIPFSLDHHFEHGEKKVIKKLVQIDNSKDLGFLSGNNNAICA